MDTLNNLIASFTVDKLKQFLRQKISTFKPDEENYEYLFRDNENIAENYEDIEKIGEADLTNSDDLLNKTSFDYVNKKIQNSGVNYPPMKLLDMYF